MIPAEMLLQVALNSYADALREIVRKLGRDDVVLTLRDDSVHVEPKAGVSVRPVAGPVVIIFGVMKASDADPGSEMRAEFALSSARPQEGPKATPNSVTYAPGLTGALN